MNHGIFRNWIVSSRMERMAFDDSLQGKPCSFHDSETVYRKKSVGGARGSETTARTKKGGKGTLIELNYKDYPSF
jgi:hypothetical protein